MNLGDMLDNLLKEGKIKKQKTDSNYLNNLLQAAYRNFEAAAVLKDKYDEASFKLVYDGLLQISRAVVLLNGYRPDDGEQHKTTFLITGNFLGAEFNELIAKIQRFRIKRNDCIYHPLDLISKSETEAIFKTAKEFWYKVKIYLEKKNPQLKLFEGL